MVQHHAQGGEQRRNRERARGALVWTSRGNTLTRSVTGSTGPFRSAGGPGPAAGNGRSRGQTYGILALPRSFNTTSLPRRFGA